MDFNKQTNSSPHNSNPNSKMGHIKTNIQPIYNNKTP